MKGQRRRSLKSSINDGERNCEKASDRGGIPGSCDLDGLGAVLRLLGAPYGYGPGYYNYGGLYAPQPYAEPPGYYGYDPYGSAYNWDYYRVDRPGRGNNVESTVSTMSSSYSGLRRRQRRGEHLGTKWGQ